MAERKARVRRLEDVTRDNGPNRPQSSQKDRRKAADPSPTDSVPSTQPGDVTPEPAAAPAPRSNPPDSSPLPDDATFRYEDLGMIGMGAMGEVRRVRDRDLNRVVAMKIVRPSLMKNRRLLARFIAEAQATAQLTHPGIVPIHELGVLPDGRFFFAMKEVQGKTLREVINVLHGNGETDSGSEVWTLRRVIEVFRQVCNSVAYGHSRGVVHRDLKPDNIMVGSFGEVLVLDWGLAKVVRPVQMDDTIPVPVITNRSSDNALATVAGTVAGTPSYMPPEQAMGQFAELGPTADVYALGAILYEILVGRPPYGASAAREVIMMVLKGPPPSPFGNSIDQRPATSSITPDDDAPAIPVELAALCERAMKRDPEERFGHAGELAHEVGLWLEGARKRDQALSKVAEARMLYPQVNACRYKAAKLRREAARMLNSVPHHAPASKKRPAWRLQDQAAREEREAAIKETQAVQLLHGAISLAPELIEAHDLLAEYYRERHVRADRLRHTALAARYEAILRSHDTGKHTEYLRGMGRITLRTSEPEAEVVAMRYLERGRNLVPVSPRVLGRTSLIDASIPSGTNLLLIRKDGHADVRYPVFVGRLEHWDGIPPGNSAPLSVYMPLIDELTDNECYVPAGWFLSGGDADTPGAASRKRVWLDGFVMDKFPVTVDEYLAFLNALVDDGRDTVAMQHVPRRPLREGSVDSRALLERDAKGHFVLSGERGLTRGWKSDWPITMIDWYNANAYAEWRASRTGQPWRLPAELEWEKAARGVDGRLCPWGDFMDPSFCNMRDSTSGDANTMSVHDYEIDESPYGVRGMAGNVRDFCLDVYRSGGPLIRPDGRGLVIPPNRTQHDVPRAERGGSWRSTGRAVRPAVRNRVLPSHRSPNLGFRLARSIGPSSRLEGDDE